jgi:hypothetical protein
MSQPESDPLERALREVARKSEAPVAVCSRQPQALLLVDGALAPGDVEEMEEHLASCDACRGASVDYARALAMLRETGGRRRLRRLTWLAAAAVLVALAGWLLVRSGGVEPADLDVAMVFATTRGASGAKRAGETFHLEVRAESPGHLYAALLYDSDDTCTPLAPADAASTAGERLAAGEERRFPAAPQVFVLADRPGTATLIVFYTPRALGAGEWPSFLERLDSRTLFESTARLASDHAGSRLILHALEIVR